jgi:hypothetical protein
VLAAIGEPLDLIEYNRWNVVLPEGTFLTEVSLRWRRNSRLLTMDYVVLRTKTTSLFLL